MCRISIGRIRETRTKKNQKKAPHTGKPTRQMFGVSEPKWQAGGRGPGVVLARVVQPAIYKLCKLDPIARGPAGPRARCVYPPVVFLDLSPRNRLSASLLFPPIPISLSDPPASMMFHSANYDDRSGSFETRMNSSRDRQTFFFLTNTKNRK